MFKSSNKLLIIVKQHVGICSKCFPLELTYALRRTCHWLTAWSMMLWWMP